MKNLFRGRGRVHPSLMPHAPTPGVGVFGPLKRPCEGIIAKEVTYERRKAVLARDWHTFDELMYPSERAIARKDAQNVERITPPEHGQAPSRVGRRFR